MEVGLQGEQVSTVSKRALAFGHTFVLGALFFPPFCLCVSLDTSPDVAYFAGRSTLVPLILVVALLFVPLVHMYRTKGLHSFVILSLIVPLGIFAGVGGFMRERTQIAQAALYNRDCLAFEDKRALYNAFQAAEELWTSCTKEQGIEELSVVQCPGFDKIRDKFLREVRYLEALEARFDCAGICRDDRKRLFHDPGLMAPSCGLFVAQYLRGASTQATTVLWYSIITFVIAIATYQKFFKKIVKKHHCDVSAGAEGLAADLAAVPPGIGQPSERRAPLQVLAHDQLRSPRGH